MARYLIVRAGLGLVTIAGVVLLTFVLQFSLPGDPARRIAGPRASPEVLATVRANLHLDDSVPSQLVTYVSDVAQGDLGVSYIRRRPVIDLIMERLPATAVLAVGGLVVEVILGGGLGLWDGLRRKRSRGLAAANVVLLSIPTYSLGFLLLVVFAYRLDLLPLGGGTSAKELILPAATLGLFGVPYYAAVVSESTRTALSASYMRTAVAKGLPRRVILRRHVIRNCLSPVITLAGLDVAIYLSGVVFVESVFAWPGIGQLQEQAYNELDRPLLMGTVIIAAVVVVAFNLVADVIRALVDPRARVEETG
jgi:ABC-type dipeptide/oligopeptide/nickel transport system permease component